MILNNLTNVLKNLAVYGVCGNINMPIVYPVIDTAGNELKNFYVYGTTLPFNSALVFSDTTTGLNSATNLHLGTGTTPAKATDYTMENIITKNVKLSNSTVTFNTITDEENNTCTKKINLVCSITNTGTNDLNISEIGISGMFLYGSSSSTRKNVMYFREVLESPITIAPGNMRTLQFDFEFTNQLG